MDASLLPPTKKLWLMPDIPYTVPQVVHSHSKHPPNIWILGPTQVHIPIGILIGLIFLVGLTDVTNRHTQWDSDHAMSATTGSILYRGLNTAACISTSSRSDYIGMVWPDDGCSSAVPAVLRRSWSILAALWTLFTKSGTPASCNKHWYPYTAKKHNHFSEHFQV